MLGEIEAILPTIVAILGLTLFTPGTRWMCYTAVLLSIIAELIPMVINSTALIACSACLVAMFILELLRSKDAETPMISGGRKVNRA